MASVRPNRCLSLKDLLSTNLKPCRSYSRSTMQRKMDEPAPTDGITLKKLTVTRDCRV